MKTNLYDSIFFDLIDGVAIVSGVGALALLDFPRRMTIVFCCAFAILAAIRIVRIVAGRRSEKKRLEGVIATERNRRGATASADESDK